MGYLELLFSIDVKQYRIGQISFNREFGKKKKKKKRKKKIVTKVNKALFGMEITRSFAMQNVSKVAMFESEAGDESVAERAKS